MRRKSCLLLGCLNCLTFGGFALEWGQALSLDTVLSTSTNLQLLQAGKEYHPSHLDERRLHSAKARASLDSFGLPTLEFDEVTRTHSSHKLKGELLEEAAMAAAALAVREEAKAARAVGGGEPARLLASTHLKSHAERSARHLISRFEVINEEANESHTNSSSPRIVNQSSPWTNPQGVNPFNPFSNPFFNPFTPNPYTPLHTGGGRGSNLLFILFVFILAAAGCAVACGGVWEDDDDISSGDESHLGLMGLNADARRGRENIKRKVQPAEKSRGCLSWLSCCGCCRYCSKTVILFTLGAMLLTFLGGKILWNSGILQPLLAQLLLYAYVILIILGFAVVITHELTRKIRRTVDSIYRSLVDFQDVMPHWLKNRKEASPYY
ncbi:unnamed protein product [Durusdinium trenchii]|uniref:Transmembrane protein n=2 Tax=Durusdinium trenchii TaxID=1381693 RepID=A0ABP0RFR6_9DINO